MATIRDLSTKSPLAQPRSSSSWADVRIESVSICLCFGLVSSVEIYKVPRNQIPVDPTTAEIPEMKNRSNRLPLF